MSPQIQTRLPAVLCRLALVSGGPQGLVVFPPLPDTLRGSISAAPVGGTCDGHREDKRLVPITELLNGCLYTHGLIVYLPQ
jgi:hypothetical protein